MKGKNSTARNWKSPFDLPYYMANSMFRICLLLGLLCQKLSAQTVDFQFYGKSIPEIQRSLYSATPVFHAAEFLPDIAVLSATTPLSGQEIEPLFFSAGLAPWKPEDMPFFCRIEHEVGKKLPLLFKFRLGSVDYVDWLEGKGIRN